MGAINRHLANIAAKKEVRVKKKKRVHSGTSGSEGDDGTDLHAPVTKRTRTTTQAITTEPAPGKSAKQLTKIKPARESRQAGVRQRGEWKRRQEAIVTRLNIRMKSNEFNQTSFGSWGEFDEKWEDYVAANFLCYRIRDSRKTVTHNENEKRHYDIPEHFEDSKRVLYCTHGCVQAGRGNGIRNHASVRYTGCKARATFIVAPQRENGQTVMRVVLVSQSVEHNHYLSEEMFANYMKGEKISDLLLLGTIDLLEHTGTDTAQVASYLSHETGSHVTSQDVRNLIAKRLGGATSEERMTSLITRFAETSGNHAAVIEDQHGMACGVVVQSAAQVEAFSLWGDAVVMDWTYNTNNRSYNLGSLVVTGPTGRGIPVLDFLCINEKKETLSAVLTYFKDKNPSWDKIEAFVTDKDFTELSTLKDLFPNAKQFLCQFHAIRAVERALRNKKYGLSPAQIRKLLWFFRKLVRANNDRAFDQIANDLIKAIPRKNLLDYFKTNWLKNAWMWSNIGRAKVFSAGNTTTNRIESRWKHYKAILGKKKGIDRCVRALFQHLRSILGHLDSALTAIVMRSRTQVGVPAFLQTVSHVVSNFVLEKLIGEWNHYAVASIKWNSTFLRTATYEVTCKSSVFEIDTKGWKCTCIFNVSHRLPCRHIMHVCVNVLKRSSLPVQTIPSRWSMSNAQSIKPAIKSTVETLSTLTFSSPSSIATESTDEATKRCRFDFVRLKRRERHEMLVLTRAEKYNIIQGEFDRVRQILQGSSSRKFYARIRSFTDAMAGLADTWKQEPDSDGDDESATISSVDANIDTIESDEGSIWTDGDEVNEMLDKFLSDGDDATNVDDYVGATDSAGDVEVIDLDGDVEVSNGDGDGVGEVEVEVSFTHSKQVDTKNADDSLMDWLVDNPSQVDFPDVIMTTASQIATGITLLTPAAATQSDLRMRKDAIKSSEKKAVHNSPRGISMVHSGAGLIETVAQLTVTRPKGKTLTPEVLEKLRAGGAAYRAEFALRKRKKNQQMQHHAEREQRITQMTDGRSDHLDDQVGGQVGNRVDFPPLYPATLGMTREDPNQPRIAVQRRKKEFPVSIADMLYWVRYFDGVAFVSQCIERYPVTTFTLRHPTISLVTLLPSMHMHNYTLTETALLKFVGAIEARRIEDTGSSKRAPIIWNHDELTEMYVARVRNESASFTELYLDMVSELSDYRLLTKEWREDWQWLVATDWRKSALAEQMMSIDLGPVKEMAKIAGKKFSQSYLHRPFCAPIPGTESFHEISFKSIIGHVAREKWLQSAQLMHAIYLSLRGRTDVFVIDSLAVKLQTYSPPKRRDIKTIRYIIQPHNIDNQHWTVMIVHLDFSSGIQAFVYDPLIIDENIEILTATWHSFTLPFIKQWYNRDHGTEASILDSSKEEHAQATPRKLFPVLRCQIIEQPVQDDFHSCGIFCIGMVDSVVNKTSDFRKRHSISATDLKALRLKVLCATLSESVGRIEEEENITMRKVKVARITAELQKLKA